MQHTSFRIKKRTPRALVAASAMPLKSVTIISVCITTAIAVFFVVQANALRDQSNAVQTEDVMKTKAQSVSTQPSTTDVKITQRVSGNESKSTEDQSIGARSDTTADTHVNVNDTSVHVKDNGTVHKVIKGKNGSSEITIRSNSTSHGSNESSLDLDLNYSTSSEVSRDVVSGE